MFTISSIQEQWIAYARALYNRAFPKNERIPFSDMLHNKNGASEIFVFFNDATFIGFACMANALDISHITYLAVEEAEREKGYGSQMLSFLHQEKQGRRIIVDIELPEKNTVNKKQRLKRKAFYTRAGYQETSIRYRWSDEDYEILPFGGKVTEKEFEKFWKEIIG